MTDIHEEIERAEAHLAVVEPVLRGVYAGIDLSDEEHTLLLSVMGAGMLSGMAIALRCLRDGEEIDYSHLIPNDIEDLV